MWLINIGNYLNLKNVICHYPELCFRPFAGRPGDEYELGEYEEKEQSNKDYLYYVYETFLHFRPDLY